MPEEYFRGQLFTVLAVMRDVYRNWDGADDIIYDLEHKLGVPHGG